MLPVDFFGSGVRPAGCLAGRPARRPAGRSSAARVSSAAPKKKSFDRGGPVWPPRSNVTNDRLRGDPSLDVGLPPPSSAECAPTTKTKENLTSFSILISTSILWNFTFILKSFFGSKTDVFDKFLLPEFELQLEIRSAKIVILPRENAVFYKIDILALKWQPMKNIKKTGKTSLRNQVVFSH